MSDEAPEDDSPPEKTETSPRAGIKNKGAGDKTITADPIQHNINVSQKPTLPTVGTEPAEYTPMMYIFRLPPCMRLDSFLNQTARVPPFYIQLDHAIATIWVLFSSQAYKHRLGINQLQWALAFLKTIKNQKGRMPRDVAFCADTISNILIDQYAQLIDDVTLKIEPVATSSKVAVDTTGEDNPPKNLIPEKSLMFEKSVPFSINYADMIERSPPQPAIPYSKPDQLPDEFAKNMGTYLYQWRKEQMEKLMVELDRLNTIEKYMYNTGENYEPYIDEKDKELSTLLCEKIKKLNC